MTPLASKLLRRGDEISIELGRIIIQPASGKPVPPEWLKKHTAGLAREILTALGLEAYEFCGYTTGHYGPHKAPGVTLQFLSPTTDASPYVIFNAELTRCRNVGAAKKGTALPKGHFRIGKRSHFYRFWRSTELPEPKRLSSFHDYMGNLKGILFTATVQNDRMDASSLRPLTVPSRLVHAAILPDKLQTTPRHIPDSVQTRMPDKDFAQSQGAHAFQAKQTTSDKNYGNKVIKGRGFTGASIPPYQHKRPEDQSVDEWLADYSGADT
ncbi:hypothetical protein [Pseudomonas sp. BN411]|uniref:hypothetical protein n=1 Tax=Pseudomonas sp. BN411 TaxID=2567887 RepID=UPI002457816F|nr:hypothetical protein [Pseudomonas sp. BN411]MDH4560209.1 hypothetical protein [Pseudomonas sp. BN411]